MYAVVMRLDTAGVLSMSLAVGDYRARALHPGSYRLNGVHTVSFAMVNPEAEDEGVLCS
jgi:hypothetical protein